MCFEWEPGFFITSVNSLGSAFANSSVKVTLGLRSLNEPFRTILSPFSGDITIGSSAGLFFKLEAKYKL